jgi:hypothetical protein
MTVLHVAESLVVWLSDVVLAGETAPMSPWSNANMQNSG